MSDQLKPKKMLIKAINVQKIYTSGIVKTAALQGINLEIYEGDYRLILGPSGCGKTTLLNILGGINTATTGEILVVPPNHYQKKRKTSNNSLPSLRNITTFTAKELVNYRRFQVGIIFQFYNLIPILTALENVELTARLARIPNPHIEAQNYLKIVGLEDKENQYPGELSGGEQQRVAIARALVKKPHIILADEPTGNLDSQRSKEIYDLLEIIAREYNTAVLVVTHDNTIAELYGKNHIHIIDGKLKED